MKKETSKEKVLDVLLANPGDKLYLTQISQAAGTAIATTQHVLETQLKDDFVIKEKVGNLSYYRLDFDNPLVKQAKKTSTLQEISQLVQKLKDFSEKIILFGSCSRGEDTVESDIDLFILSNEEETIRKIIKNTKTKRQVAPIIKNYPEWMILKEKKKYLYEEISKGEVLWEQKNE